MAVELEKKADTFVSVVMVTDELEGQSLEAVIGGIYQYLDKRYADCEILIVENIPGAIKKKELEALLAKVPCIRFIELAYEINYEMALTIGLENSIGDYVVIYNPQQETTDVIGPIVQKCQQQADVVIGVANNIKNTIGYRILRPMVAKLYNEIGYSVPRNSTTLHCLSRNAVNSATKARSNHHQLFVKIAQCGLDVCSFDYEVIENSATDKGVFKGMKKTVICLVFNSTKPLRWMSFLGIFGSFLAFLFATFSFVSGLVSNNVADGWSSAVIFLSVLFMLLFIILSFFGEYLGRLLYDQSKHAPYWIVKERHSSVMVDTNRHNVIEES